MNTIQELIASIMKGELDIHLRAIMENCEARLKLKKQDTLVPGAKVRIGKIRPTYVSNSLGTVVTIEDDHCIIDLDAPALGPLVKGRRKRYQLGLKVPLSCVSAVGEQVNFRKN